MQTWTPQKSDQVVSATSFAGSSFPSIVTLEREPTDFIEDNIGASDVWNSVWVYEVASNTPDEENLSILREIKLNGCENAPGREYRSLWVADTHTQ